MAGVDRAPWAREGEEKRAFVRGMFADVAPSYDLVNSLMCFRQHHRWRAAAVRALGLRRGDRALDVCCGTGDFLAPLRRAVGPEGSLLGVDFCAPMLERARDKRTGAGLLLGDAGRLPVLASQFDGVTVGWGLRNVPDIGLALREACRALKPGGRFATLDMARPRSALVGRLSEAVFHRVVPLIGRVFGKTEAYTYLPKSTLRFLSRQEMAAAMEAAGFGEVRWRDFFFGNVCLHWGVKR
jgi:demethylmenaquinone methyltransferase/2-methoxy-6-polyprenyl-1,4-benzoquinol methylase